MYLEYQLLNGPVVRAYNSYNEAKRQAEKQKLLLAEYGDVCGSNMAYAYWNKTGDRYDDEAIIAYYKTDNNGKPVTLAKEKLKSYLFN